MKLFKLPLCFWCNVIGEIREMPQCVNASLFLVLQVFFWYKLRHFYGHRLWHCWRLADHIYFIESIRDWIKTDFMRNKVASSYIQMIFVCGVLFDYKTESAMEPSGVRAVTLVTDICSQLAECLYATFCNQTLYFGAPPWAGMSCEKTGILSSRSRSYSGLI